MYTGIVLPCACTLRQLLQHINLTVDLYNYKEYAKYRAMRKMWYEISKCINVETVLILLIARMYIHVQAT